MQLFLNVLIFMSTSQKEKREKSGRGMGNGLLNPLEVTSAKGKGLATMERKLRKNRGCPPLCLHLCGQKQQLVIRAKIPDV